MKTIEELEVELRSRSDTELLALFEHHRDTQRPPGTDSPLFEDRAWIVVPAVALLIPLGVMVAQRRLTLRSVLLAAVVALAIGAFLKVT